MARCVQAAGSQQPECTHSLRGKTRHRHRQIAAHRTAAKVELVNAHAVQPVENFRGAILDPEAAVVGQDGLTETGQVGRDDAEMRAKPSRGLAEMMRIGVESMQQNQRFSSPTFEVMPAVSTFRAQSGLQAFEGQKQTAQRAWKDPPEQTGHDQGRSNQEPDSQCVHQLGLSYLWFRSVRERVPHAAVSVGQLHYAAFASEMDTAMHLDRGLTALTVAMVVIVASANYLVQFPVNNWLTWGALTYPLSYFITDLTNRHYGKTLARRVVLVGFVLAVLASIWLASPRIALASGSAFLVSQLMDVMIFDRLRSGRWWQAPLVSSTLGSLVDTALFFALAFYGTGMPWVTLAIGDYGVKVLIAIGLLAPWWLVVRRG